MKGNPPTGSNRRLTITLVVGAFACGIVPIHAQTAEIDSAQQSPTPAEIIRPTGKTSRLVPARSLLQDGLRAIGEGLPQAAAYRLRAFLQSDSPQDQRREATLALVRALLATEDAEEAAIALREQALPESDVQMRYWRAQIQFARKNWEEALKDFQAAAADGAPLENEARFGWAETLLVLKRPAEADRLFEELSQHSRLGIAARLRRAGIALDEGNLKKAAELLSPMPDSLGSMTPHNTQLRAALLGRLRLLQHQPKQTEQLIGAALARPVGMSESLLVDNHQGLARAYLAENNPGKAEDTLEDFLDRYPWVAAMPNMLAWLDELYAVDPAPDDLADLRRWSADTAEPKRQALATLALSRGEARSGRLDWAEMILANFSRDFPDHPLRAKAWVELATLRLRGGRPAEARQALAQARALAADHEPGLEIEIDALNARISLSEGNNSEAAKKFQAIAARAGTPALTEAASFNAVLGWMRAADATRAAAAESDFIAHYPSSQLIEEFSLEEGLAEAARSHTEDITVRQHAAALLRRFLQNSPLHARAPEARIALAELAFLRPKPNLTAAWGQLGNLGFIPVQNPSSPSFAADPRSDRAEYLAIWLADAPGEQHNEDTAVALAKQFLERRSDSTLIAEVRMKLSEIYFRQGDYSDSQTQLELLVEKTPQSPLAEQAQYLAGLAAERLMNPAGLDKAVKLFGDTARRNGAFKLSARLRQAEVQVLLKRPQDALTVYEDVISATSEANLTDAALEARCAALAGKGQTLLDLGASDPKHYSEAQQVFDLLANTPKASLPWRRQALTKKGLSLEKMGDTRAALATYVDALDAEPASNESPEPEWTWFYRAGSEAARMLEAKEDWVGAVAIYRKLAAADGSQKSVFENRLKSRELEHFIWPEDPSSEPASSAKNGL